MGDGWYAYQSSNGDILFFYNKFTEEYRWLSCACTKRFKDILFQDTTQDSQTITSKCTKNVGTETDPLPFSTTKELKTQATQTDFEPADVCMEDVSSANPVNTNVQQIKQEPGINIEPQRRENSRRGNKIKLHPCPYCSKAFTSHIFLKKHIKCHSIETQSQANNTGSPTGSNSPENVEILDESKDSLMEDGSGNALQSKGNIVQCFQCDKKFSSAQALDEHFILHYDDVHCNGCNKTFGCNKSYRAHLNVHFGETHQCQHCPKKYAIKVGLLRHIRYIHKSVWNADLKGELLQLESNVNPVEEPETSIEQPERVRFQCDRCDVGFDLYSELVSHQENCNKTQEQSTSVSEDTSPSVFSEKKKQYWCNACDLYYSSLKCLLRHKKVSQIHKFNSRQVVKAGKQTVNKSVSPVHYSSRSFYCLDCSLSFETYESLKKHRKNCSHSNKLENNKYRCLYCPEICVSRVQLTKHVVTHIPINRNGVFPCNQCNKQFKDKDMLERHMSYHLSMHPCSICDMKFAKFTDLKRHKRKQHKSSSLFTCTLCFKKFNTSSSLSNHYRIHNKGEAGACTVCGKAFTYGKNLRSHMKKCKRKMPVTIASCQESGGGAFQGQTAVQSSHIDESFYIASDNQDIESMDLQAAENSAPQKVKNEPCENDASFSQDNDMNNNSEETNDIQEDKPASNCPNLRLRKGYNYSENQYQDEYVKKENKFQCTTCKSYFSSRYALIRHQDLKRHGDRSGKGTGKRFKCKPCKKGFHLYSVFYQHQRKHHSQNKSQCKKCNMLFSSSKLLSFHKCTGSSTSSSLNDNATVQHECQECKATFSSGIGLSNHMRGHQFQSKPKIWECKCCMKIFENEKRLKKHRRTEAHSENVLKQKNNEVVIDEKRFECSGCGKFYKSRQLLLKHRNNFCKALQRIPCPSCDKLLQSYPAFVEHQKSEHNGGKPCWLCDKSFSNFGNLTRHLKDHHKDAKNFICFYCSKGFDSMSSYNLHMGHNSEKHCCKFCDERFSSCLYLTQHISACHS